MTAAFALRRIIVAMPLEVGRTESPGRSGEPLE
ncbi:hypothetical protein JOE57_003139 [Microlunatus panaciterrae]|uniref:Uncharacterized protein n=1 Tax=Microlunatus panaciterrae TaxID=400768 RepID=A0ABS2RMI2_9ACTN|nr:hypothetical protein [Microlunatus panaciterrae]